MVLAIPRMGSVGSRLSLLVGAVALLLVAVVVLPRLVREPMASMEQAVHRAEMAVVAAVDGTTTVGPELMGFVWWSG